jgi:hypothetical protein
MDHQLQLMRFLLLTTTLMMALLASLGAAQQREETFQAEVINHPTPYLYLLINEGIPGL